MVLLFRQRAQHTISHSFLDAVAAKHVLKTGVWGMTVPCPNFSMRLHPLHLFMDVRYVTSRSQPEVERLARNIESLVQQAVDHSHSMS